MPFAVSQAKGEIVAAYPGKTLDFKFDAP